MKYYEILDLQCDPFANTPDPANFYLSEQHYDCLQQLELIVRLRRGLGLVLGEVGTGKTTVCRRLIRTLNNYGPQRLHIRLFLDPDFRNSRDMLVALIKAFGLRPEVPEELGEWQLKEIFKKFLLEESGRQDRNVLLIIDEGQKLRDSCLDLIRELLNYETNDKKLVQVLVFAQDEFREQLQRHAYFRDRIAKFVQLRPLSWRETKGLINFRVSQAADNAHGGDRLFSGPATWLIHRHTRGYPRRIVMLCSQVLLAVISRRLDSAAKSTPKIRWSDVRSCIRSQDWEKWAKKRKKD